MRAVGLIALLGFATCASACAAAQELSQACDAAASRAERDWNVPAGVLSAVGTVESGRQLGALGAAPWPWTINAAGHGWYFESKQAAIDAVLELMLRGYPYIDIGCFQIDIAYHPDVFRSLDDAFDPERNAQAAARILAAERLRVADWATAVAHYHSATPELGLPYLQRVRAALPQARLRGLDAGFPPLANPTAISNPYAVTLRTAGEPALPTVVYPSPPLGSGPQVVVVGAAQRLPSVATIDPVRSGAPR